MVALGSEMDGSKAVQSDNVHKNPVTRVKRPERPSREQLNSEVSKVYEEINALQARMEEISSLVNGRHQGRNSLSAQIVDAKKRLSDLNMQFKSVLDEKKAVREELEMADKSRERMRQEARSLRDKLPYVRVEEIDEEIKRIEYRIAHTSLTSQEEQRLIKQVSNMRKTRDFVSEYTAKTEKLSTDESSRSALLQTIKEKDQILNEIKKQQEEERKQFDSLKEKESTELSDIPALIEEKNAAFGKIKNLRDHITQLRNDFQLKEQEYWSKEKEWRQQQTMDRKLKIEKREAEWKEREEIRRQRQLENYVPPYTDELITCDQLSSYLQKFVPVEKESASAPQQTENVSHKGFEDLHQIKKNRPDEDLGGWFSGLGSKGKSKKGKGSAGGKSKERISLSIDALSSFQKVGLRAPSTVGDVPASLIELKAKKELFLKRQSEATNPKDNGSDGVHDLVNKATEPAKETVDPCNSDDGQEENKDMRRLSCNCKLCEQEMALLHLPHTFTTVTFILPQTQFLSIRCPKWRNSINCNGITPRSLFGWGGSINSKKDSPTYHNIDPPFPPSLLQDTFLAGKEVRCCYRACEDGFSATSFHNHCDFKGPCVIVGYTQKGLRFGGFNPEGYRSTDDYSDTLDAFLFYWPQQHDDDAEEKSEHVELLPKVGGSGAALFDYRRGGPQFGADGLLIGPPMASVMGGFAGPDTNSGVGDLKFAKSRLGLSYAKRSDGKDSVFGDDRTATLVDVLVFCSPQIADLYR